MLISRSLLEELISVYFMQLMGKEKMAQKFSNYTYVELKLEQAFLLLVGVGVNKELFESTNEGYNQVKKDFIFGKGKISSFWAKCSTEDMIKELVKEGIITPEWEECLAHAYLMGNRKIHLSSYDSASYFNLSTIETVLQVSAEVGMMMFQFVYCVLLLSWGKK